MYDRYHIAYAPHPKTQLWEKGAAWLAYNAATGEPPKKVQRCGLPEPVHQKLTEPARRKGFNASIYPAFRLKPDVSLKELKLYLERYCKTKTAFNSGVMKLQAHANQIVIEPIGQNPSIQELADECVHIFDPLREKGNPIPINDRMKTALTQSQINNFVKWGHPYLFDDYKFNIQLTGALSEKIAPQLCSFLQKHFLNGLTNGMMMNGLSLFGQEGPDKPARMIYFAAFQQNQSTNSTPPEKTAVPT